MKAVAIGLVAGALLLAPGLAWAGSSCSGSSDSSSSSSSSGSSGSSSSSDSSSSSSSSACVETSDIVGRQQCGRFGTWSRATRLPAITLTLGSSVHVLPAGGFSLSGSASHEDSVAYRVGGADVTGSGDLVAMTADLRATVGIARHGYVGVHAAVGGAATEGRSLRDGPLEIEPLSVTYFEALGVAGVAAPLGRLRLSAELGAGVRALSVVHETRLGDCVSTSFATAAQTFTQAGLGAAYWWTPWLSTGGRVATDLGAGGTSAGIFVSGHLRSFDTLF